MTEDELIAKLDAEFGATTVTPTPSSNIAIVEPRERASAQGAMENIGPSASQYASDLATIFTDPMLIAEGVKLMFTGDGLKQLKSFYDDRYGSVYQAMQTAYKDPVGFASDFSLIGAPVKLAGQLGKIAAKKVDADYAVPALDVVRKAGDIAESADPLGMATEATLGVASNLPGVRSFPESEYETQLKMGTSPRTRMGQTPTRSRVIDTLLREQIPITPEGLGKLQGMVDKQTGVLESLVKQAEDAGKMIPLRSVLEPLKKLRQSLSDPEVNPKSVEQVEIIDAYVQNWIESLGPVRSLSPTKVLELRRNLDRQINWDSMPSTEPPLSRQITEEVASGARASLRDTVDEYGSTGRNISDLLTAEEALQRAVNRLSQNQSVGLKSTIGSVGGATMAGIGEGVQQIAGLLLASGSLLANPANKARVARLIYQHRGLTNEQKRTLLGLVASQAGPTAQRIEEGAE